MSTSRERIATCNASISRRRFFQTGAAGATGAAIGVRGIREVSAMEEGVGQIPL
jgi:hypothetical protein